MAVVSANRSNSYRNVAMTLPSSQEQFDSKKLSNRCLGAVLGFQRVFARCPRVQEAVGPHPCRTDSQFVADRTRAGSGIAPRADWFDILLAPLVGVAGLQRITHPFQHLVVKLQPAQEFGELP